ncbi:hypothetical protein SLEP1_g47876 [Rubroshorea leprosula]|uniref:Uncharacterized protein n=1 Tax=Rubroshorea leprosula TaxID=152421 RepID=A0AAV5LTQ8_9ROSI|nr:hypothetical protein SLEP1_g47876 [Rubroshorea leprosula]
MPTREEASWELPGFGEVENEVLESKKEGFLLRQQRLNKRRIVEFPEGSLE